MATYEHAKVDGGYSTETRGYRYYAELPSGMKVFDPAKITITELLNLLGSQGWALVAIEPGAREIDPAKYWLRREI